MRILHVITTLDTGGAERLMVDLLPRLIDKGNKVELLLFNGFMTPFRKELEERGVTIHELTVNEKGGDVYNLSHIFKLRQFMKDYDVIHTHNTACQLYVPIAKALSHSSVKLVTTDHSTNSRRRSLWWFRPIEKWMYQQYDDIICIGDVSRDNLERYLSKGRHARVIYNGVNTKRFIRSIKDVSNQDSFIVTMVAGLRVEKDHDTLIRSLNHLPSNYRLRLVGGGQREQELKSLCQELSLNERVDFMGARMDIPEILEQSDVIVLSSHWEGLSLSSIEGMASGRPFVASDVDGLREMVGGVGVLFPHGDDKALAQKIQWLCEHPDEYREVAQRCQEKACKYDISVTASKYLELYEELLRM